MRDREMVGKQKDPRLILFRRPRLVAARSSCSTYYALTSTRLCPQSSYTREPLTADAHTYRLSSRVPVRRSAYLLELKISLKEESTAQILVVFEMKRRSLPLLRTSSARPFVAYPIRELKKHPSLDWFSGVKFYESHLSLNVMNSGSSTLLALLR